MMSVLGVAKLDLIMKEISGEENKNCWLSATEMPGRSSMIRLFTYYLQMKCLLNSTDAYNEKTSEG